jgi:predicted lipoprotein with Yx(FWY)xxD motif
LFIMKRTLIPGAVAAAVALVVAGCGGGSSSSSTGSTSSGTAAAGQGSGYGGMSSTPAPATAGRLALADHGLGRMLVDGSGRSLYLFKADKTPQSTCSGGCAEAWPPVTDAAKVKAGAGVDAHLIGASKRDDGTMQVTYAGHPLYLYAGDTAAGQVNGQGIDGFGALWWVVAPDGAAITKAAS